MSYEYRATVIGEKYGRYLARLVMGGVDVNQAMVEDGHATAYDGGKR